MSRSFIRVFASIAFVAVLAGCEAFEQEVASCPTVRVPADVGKIVRFADGPGRDITDVIFEAEFQSVRGTCEENRKAVETAVLIELSARRGPAGSQESEIAEVFVAVTDLNRNILVRRSLPIGFAFPGNQSLVGSVERLVIDIPKADSASGSDFFLFTGFVLTEDELAFNRSTR